MCFKTGNNCINVMVCRVVYRNNFLFVHMSCYLYRVYSHIDQETSRVDDYTTKTKTKYVVYTKDYNLLSVY